MLELSQSLRKSIVLAIEEGAAYREQLDLSRFLAMGVTIEQIHLIDTTISHLRLHPYLNQHDFESKHGVQKVRLTIGNLDNFKALLHLEEYTYRDWLKSNSLTDDEPLCLPYIVYQYFYHEIRRDFMDGALLVENLQVQLGAKQVSHLRFRCGTTVRIPADEFELMMLILISRYGRYTGFKINFADSILTLTNQCESVDIEVRLYTSSVSGKAIHAISLIDDLPVEHKRRNSKPIALIEELAIRHQNNFNGELLGMLDFLGEAKNDDE
ncbi:hypothetical protein WB851_003581 [Vibrio parahaemolyticus]|uniref:hypothetical protein n=1 Tax=Vibrio parahaemolyticus TaxID=670 RepID=UPI001B824159|nr:hypothetical protein [Vibrio parahaemolyticus]ELB2156364.1 hypothetical protein [Vibrio parahaemolyticus]ELY2120707.1 hypothetical protein [Vibrio parahaemolyticus]HBC3593309.1 hypothetical protein [Vibrio parahaemolyticus]